MINAADGYHIWSENYDRDLVDIFQIQDEISGIIANRLRENLTEEERRKQPSKSPVQNIEAYTAYLKGLHFWNKLTPADMRTAIASFEQAIALEPNYAQAHAMLAGALSYLGSSGQMNPAKAFAFVHQHADIALGLDPKVAEGHISKAAAYLFYEWKFKEAHDALQRAIQLNPAATTAYHLLSFYHILAGEKRKSRAAYGRSYEESIRCPQ